MSTNDLRSVATEFLDIAFNQGESELAASKYVGDQYIQHNPQVADGADAFIDFVHTFRKQFPDLHLETKHALS